MFNIMSDVTTAAEEKNKEEEKELEERAADYFIAIELLCEYGIQKCDKMNQDVYIPICRILKSLGGPDYPDYEVIYNLGDPNPSVCNSARMKEELDKIKD
jgi:hypothetical protein